MDHEDDGVDQIFCATLVVRTINDRIQIQASYKTSALSVCIKPKVRVSLIEYLPN